MIRRPARRSKDADRRFAEPPWNENSPQWQQIDARLPADHLARRINEMVDQLDLSRLFQSYDGRGSKAHRPDLLLKMALYEIQCGRQSPAQWHRDLRENEAVKWLAFGIQPCRAAVYDFRDRLVPCWDDWNAQVLQMAQQQGLTVGERGALDGSQVAALASRHKLVNQKALHRRMEELREAIKADEQQKPSEDMPGWMAKHPDTRQQQRERYEQTQARMDQLQTENRKRAAGDRKKPEKIMIRPGDPEAPVARDKLKVFRPLYNVQLIYDLDSPLITAYDVFPWQNDAATMEPMLERATEMTGRKPETLLADSGYTGGPDVAVCEHHGVTLYAPVSENDFSKAKRSGKKPTRIPKKDFTWLPTHCGPCPRQESCASNPKYGRTISRQEHEELIEKLRQRMETPEAKALYKLRRQTVELRYADIKEHRNLRRFTGRGLRRAKAQLGATVLAHNLVALSRTDISDQTDAAPTGIPEKIPP